MLWVVSYEGINFIWSIVEHTAPEMDIEKKNESEKNVCVSS